MGRTLRCARRSGRKPYTNGAYRLTPPRNVLGQLDKVEGCLYAIQGFLDRSGWRRALDRWMAEPPPLAKVGAWYTRN
jgi:hypothetical protein